MGSARWPTLPEPRRNEDRKTRVRLGHVPSLTSNRAGGLRLPDPQLDAQVGVGMAALGALAGAGGKGAASGGMQMGAISLAGA